MVIWYTLLSFGIFCGHLVYFVVIWYILSELGIFRVLFVNCTYQEKSGKSLTLQTYIDLRRDPETIRLEPSMSALLKHLGQI
jgi:hypothetical protein